MSTYNRDGFVTDRRAETQSLSGLAIAVFLVGCLGAVGCESRGAQEVAAGRALARGLEHLAAGDFQSAHELCSYARGQSALRGGVAECMALAAVAMGRCDLAMEPLTLLTARGLGPEWAGPALWRCSLQTGAQPGPVPSVAAGSRETLEQILAATIAYHGDTAAFFDLKNPGTGLLWELAEINSSRKGAAPTDPEDPLGLVSSPQLRGQDLCDGIEDPDCANPTRVILAPENAAWFDSRDLELYGESLALASPEPDMDCALLPLDKSGKQSFFQAFTLARCLESKGQGTQALDLYDEILTQRPGNLLARYDRALLLGRLGRFPEALAELGYLAAISPERDMVDWSRAMLLLAAGRQDEARNLASRRSNEDDLLLKTVEMISR